MSTKWLGLLIGVVVVAFFLAPRRPSLDITVRPDGAVSGNVGIGLELRHTGWHNYSSRTAQVRVFSSSGELVHEGENRLDKFTFG